MVELISKTKAKIVSTRKTTPNLRVLEKNAVKDGGGVNHRFGLYDGILIKDNHIAASGSIKETILKAKKNYTRIDFNLPNQYAILLCVHLY